jgi:chromosome segregation ATPase
MQLKFTSLSSVAQSFIVVAACVAAPSVALADGAVLAWGDNTLGQYTIPTTALSGVTAIAGSACQTEIDRLAWIIEGYKVNTIELNSQITELTSQNDYLNSYITQQNSQITAMESQIAALTSQNTSLNSQITALTSQNTSVNSQNNVLISQNTALTSLNTSLNSQITALNSQITALTSQNATLTSQNAALTSENATLDSENAALTAQLNCGDLDGNGEVNSADIGLMLVSYGPCAQ